MNAYAASTKNSVIEKLVPCVDRLHVESDNQAKGEAISACVESFFFFFWNFKMQYEGSSS